MSQQQQQQIWIRLAFHGLLAFFLANAANKFFVADLEYELAHGFYARIFAGVGDAPDQYRLLPLIPLKAICDFLPFNHAVLVYNVAVGFLVLELFWWIMGGLPRRQKLLFQLLFAMGYIYCQYSGWRPDTLGLLAVAAAVVLPPWWTVDRPATYGLRLLQTVLLLALAFSRTDIALVYGAFLAIYGTQSWAWRLTWLLAPVGVQLLLQLVLFPEASYYSKTVMLTDNLSGYFLVRHPATWLILAVLLVFGRHLRDFVRRTWRFRWLYALLTGYLLLVLVIGRVNEWRLYLPFLPLLLSIWRTSQTDSHETGPV